jgi:hypothetical protein
MAKKKKLETTQEDIDGFFDSVCDEARNHYGQANIYTGSDAELIVVGIPLPSLSVCYLFQSTVLPFARIGQIVGEEGSCKSALLTEIFRWIRLYGGRSVLMEAESKDSPFLRKSLLNYDEKAVISKPCDSLEDWQEGLTYFTKWARQKMDGTKSKPGPGRVRPMGFGVDSLMGKACRDTIGKIEKEGCAQRSFPAEALLISQYMKYIPQQLAGWPFVLWGVNHLKPAVDARTGLPKANIAGGKSLKFQETYEIEMHRIKDIKKVDIQGISLKMVMRKNSLGPSRLSINVDMLWWFDEAHDYIQRTMFDWNAASIDLLLSFEGSRANKLNEICDLHVADKSKKLVWSNTLDIPKTDPLPYSHAGAILEDKPDVLKELYKVLHIREMISFQVGKDVREQLAEAKKLSAEQGIKEALLEAAAPTNNSDEDE